MGEKARQAALLLKILANEHRLMVFCALMGGPLTVGEIAGAIPGISQSGLSQHLALMKAHGVLACDKAGQNVTYRVADPRAGEVIGVLSKYYCESGEDGFL